VASEELSEIRGKVLALLEKYDTAKVNRIDIIMDKFKGKESLLLEKMTQRYESSAGSTTSSAEDDAKTRSQVAAQRHMERMRKLRESKEK
jgi:hypothetical protein